MESCEFLIIGTWANALFVVAATHGSEMKRTRNSMSWSSITLFDVRKSAPMCLTCFRYFPLYICLLNFQGFSGEKNNDKSLSFEREKKMLFIHVSTRKELKKSFSVLWQNEIGLKRARPSWWPLADWIPMWFRLTEFSMYKVWTKYSTYLKFH
jgi:hypothetical protein